MTSKASSPECFNWKATVLPIKVIHLQVSPGRFCNSSQLPVLKILHFQTSNSKGSADCILLTASDNTESCRYSLKSRLLCYYTSTAKVLPNAHIT